MSKLEMAEFWDTHSLADYWDQTEPAEFAISTQLRRRYLVPVDRDILGRVQQAARARGVSAEGLVNLLLEQRLREMGEPPRANRYLRITQSYTLTLRRNRN